MDARSAPSSDRARSRLRWLVQGGLVFAAALLLWFSGRAAGLWLSPVPSLLQEAPLVAPPAPQDAPSPDEAAVIDGADRAPPRAESNTVVRLYLPAIMAGPPLRVPQVRPQAVAANPMAPLQLPDPRLDVPQSTARNAQARSAPLTERSLQPETPAVVASSPADDLSDDRVAADEPVDEPLAWAAVGGAVTPTTEATAPQVEDAGVLAAPVHEPGRWIWPVQGEISQSFSERHRAIDVVSGHGALVVAADGGKVVYAEWEISGFGYLVIVDHGDDYRTYYGHLYGFYVEVGQQIERGDLLGQLGNTGNSTGPHLHFEIRYQGISREPLKLLPPGRY